MSAGERRRRKTGGGSPPPPSSPSLKTRCENMFIRSSSFLPRCQALKAHSASLSPSLRCSFSPGRSPGSPGPHSPSAAASGASSERMAPNFLVPQRPEHRRSRNGGEDPPPPSHSPATGSAFSSPPSSSQSSPAVSEAEINLEGPPPSVAAAFCLVWLARRGPG